MPPRKSRLKPALSNPFCGRQEPLYVQVYLAAYNVYSVVHCGVALHELAELAHQVALVAVRRSYPESVPHKSRARSNEHFQPPESSSRHPSLGTVTPDPRRYSTA